MQKSLNKTATLLILTLMCLGSFPAFSQSADILHDLNQIEKNNKPLPAVVKRDFLYSNSKSAFVRYNPVTLVFGSLMYTYQNLISQQLSATCLYDPSCSSFGKGAIEHFGIFKGSMLAADRITRCNRISALDIHPLKIDSHTHKASDPVELYR